MQARARGVLQEDRESERRFHRPRRAFDEDDVAPRDPAFQCLVQAFDEGAPGTMKSSLGFSILLQNAARAALHCLYLSLEERGSSLLKQMGSLGLHLEVPKGSLVVLDPRTATNLLGEKKDWLEGLRQGIQSVKDQRGLDLIVIDSLEALEVLAKFKDRRREVYRLVQGAPRRGASGTMKSSLAYYVLYHNALAGSPGLYVTLEQTAAGLLEHVAGLGLKATSVSEALPILDLSRGREYLEEMVSKVGSMSENAAPRGEALLAVLKAKIFELRMKRNFRLLAIDSWDALELVLEFDDRRAETFGFFEWLRDLGVTSLLISEEPALEAPPTALEEEFLADGIIHLRLEPVTETAFQRRVQCVKMRSVNQDSDDHTLLYENGRFEVARAIG